MTLPAMAQPSQRHRGRYAAPARVAEQFGPPAPGTPFDACDSAIATAQRGPRIPVNLLPAISRVESGRLDPVTRRVRAWPWTINVEGVGSFFDTKEQVIAAVTALQARGVRSIDVGCMQINLQSHPAAFIDLDQAFDPAANTDYGSRFLRRLRDDAGGNWYEAVGYYHSRTPVLASDYRARVAAIAAGRTPPVSLGIPLYMRAIQQGGLRIALAGGGVLRINIRRQPSLRGPRRLSACQVAAVLGPYMSAPARARCTLAAR